MAHDPLVPRLREWLQAGCETAPPTFPVPDAEDPRPAEPIPREWQDVWREDEITHEVLSEMEAVGLGQVVAIGGARCAPLPPLYRQAYIAGGAAAGSVDPALLPGNERRRQWRRVTSGQEPLPWQTLVWESSPPQRKGFPSPWGCWAGIVCARTRGTSVQS